MDIWTAGMVQRLTDDIALCGIWSIGLFVTQEVLEFRSYAAAAEQASS